MSLPSAPVPVLAALLSLAAPGVPAEPATATVETGHFRVVFDRDAAGPVGWLACDPACDAPGARVTELLEADPDGPAGILAPLLEGARGEPLRPGPADVRLEEGADAVEVVLRGPAADGRLEQRWRIPRTGHRVTYAATLADTGGARLAGLRMATGGGFRPAPMPGLGAAWTAVRPVVIRGGDAVSPEARPAAVGLHPGDRAGLRARFWVLAARTDAAAEARLPGGDVVELRPPPGEALRVELYAGPVERESLAAAGGDLPALLYSGLWDWLRWPTLGLGRLLDGLLALTGSAGLAILLLSVVVKVLMAPLTALAERWQADVNRTHARLEPLLAEARANYRGEARHERVLAAYRSLGVSPMFPVRSLAGYLIQIPVFIAAFAMLGEHFALDGAPWLWVGDLARPDAFAPLPAALPFFGDTLNLLPVVMTGLTVLAALLHRDTDLTPTLLAAQRRRLYLLAAVFFVLFYTFPAAMVLYWAANNLLHVLMVVWRRRPLS